MSRILIIDDERNIGLTIKDILEDEGHTADTALTFTDGFRMLHDETYDIVFLDIWLPDKDGTEGLKEIKQYFPEVGVVMISGHGNIENAVESIRYGAYDFMEKPLSLERIVLIVKHLLDRRSLETDLREYKRNLLKKYNLIGESSAITDLKRKIEKIAPTNAWVMINGENGTGKEHVARLIHMLSKRGNKRFVEINCSAIPGELIESEMFGHEKGAFTGAHAQKAGKFEQAHQGTLFLDEIGDMDISMQAKLLRVLELSEFTRVGGNETIHSDFRLISATNKILEDEISAGHFREDLFYRINVVPLAVPPLRKRKDDIPLLVNHFIREACSLNGIDLKEVSSSLMEVILAFDWPGNVRQLKNLIERMVVLSDADILDTDDAPSFLLGHAPREREIDMDLSIPLRDAKEQFERAFILKVLKATGWNISRASRMLDIERTYLHRKIKTYELDRHREGGIPLVEE